MFMAVLSAKAEYGIYVCISGEKLLQTTSQPR